MSTFCVLRRRILNFVVIFLMIVQVQAQALAANNDRMKVVYIVPDGTPFWRSFQGFIEEVAHDLAVDIKFVRRESGFQAMKAMKAIIAQEEKPDYFIYEYPIDGNSILLQLAEDAGIPSFIVNSDIPRNTRPLVGEPRGKMRHWIGHMYPDDQREGYRLASMLMADMQRINEDDASKGGAGIDMIAIGGASISTSSQLRERGVREKAREDNGLVLKRYIMSDWTERKANSASVELLNFYDDVSVIWTASDDLAVGAIKGVRKSGRRPGSDVLIGGFDGTLAAIKAVKQGDMSVTLGGHYMEGGWALILLHDYHHGVDFKEELGTVINMPLQAFTQENADDFLDVFGGQQWKNIDFKRFSKHYNPMLSRYDFSVNGLIAAYSY